jgi:hypothetical protein
LLVQLNVVTMTLCGFWAKLVQPKINQMILVQLPCCLPVKIFT